MLVSLRDGADVRGASAVAFPPGGAPLLTSEEWIGRVLGEKYRIVRWVADGGMGSVFEAENTWTKRHVALKILAPERSRSNERARRFLREAQSATKIDHPNIVDVFDMGQDRESGALFIVQELLKGRDLSRHLDHQPNRRIGAEEAIGLLVPIMEALEAAHQLGIIHRDVKPENIFLAQHGNVVTPKLIDFGLSKLVSPDATTGPQTGGGLLGTPHYMSPEQARGDTAVDARADVWAIGVVLYEALTGRPPFDAPTLPALLMKIATERPPPVDRDVDVPTEVAALVHRTLEPDRDRRFGSMTELLHAIRDVLEGRFPVLAATSSRTSGTFRAVRPDEEPDSAKIVVRAPAVMTAPPAPLVVERLGWVPSSKPPPAPVPRTPSSPRIPGGRARFGLVASGVGPAIAAAIDGLDELLGPRWKIVRADSYAQLVDALADGEIDLAWLPPVAYVRAVRSGAARLVLTLERDGRRSYSAAIVGRAGELPRELADLSGKRAAWVDPWSAAGYLIPRCMLRSAGFEPDRELAGQAFLGSYDAVLDAITSGAADFGAMFCRLGEQGEVVSGAWRDEARVRPIFVSAQPIPGDTICAPPSLPIERVRRNVQRFLKAVEPNEARYVFRRIFGTDRFVAANPSRYEILEAALAEDVAIER